MTNCTCLPRLAPGAAWWPAYQTGRMARPLPSPRTTIRAMMPHFCPVCRHPHSLPLRTDRHSSPPNEPLIPPLVPLQSDPNPPSTPQVAKPVSSRMGRGFCGPNGHWRRGMSLRRPSPGTFDPGGPTPIPRPQNGDQHDSWPTHPEVKDPLRLSIVPVGVIAVLDLYPVAWWQHL